MSQDKEHAEYNKALFANLVMMLSTSAMQQLGKLVNPLSHKAEVDLDGAQMTIDLLAMLQAKTQGNLSSDEARMLAGVLSSLQMNYVETARSAQTTPEKKEEKACAPAATAAAGDVGAQPTKSPDSQSAGGSDAAGAADKKDPKFHKSYGEK
ncbi:MAG: DUF1844 domain-containing protein [Verrucomicrobiota bacterium]|nr:DUF1844 domain-containing protein [Verrucomicrobiota bacterium]